jgi:hypothetical protein
MDPWTEHPAVAAPDIAVGEPPKIRGHKAKQRIEDNAAAMRARNGKAQTAAPAAPAPDNRLAIVFDKIETAEGVDFAIRIEQIVPGVTKIDRLGGGEMKVTKQAEDLVETRLPAETCKQDLQLVGIDELVKQALDSIERSKELRDKAIASLLAERERISSDLNLLGYVQPYSPRKARNKSGLRPGSAKARMFEWLMLNGPATQKEVAAGTGLASGTIRAYISANPTLFHYVEGKWAAMKPENEPGESGS